MSNLDPIRKPDSLRSYVESYLREAIAIGHFPPGKRLVERELCDLLEVSRPSVREALRKLEAEKLIKNVPHRGPVVALVTASEASDLYSVRMLMESHAVAEFTRLASDEHIKQLGVAVQRLHKASKGDDHKALLHAKAEFYDVILSNCGNLLIQELLLNLLARINLLRAASFSGKDRLAKSMEEIDALFALIKARDAAGAQEAARIHVKNAEQAALIVLAAKEAEIAGD
jgi:DNA-binding GntR family transcriptional regulator